MAKLVWDAVGEHYFENGTKHGVLFTMEDDGSYNKGVAWNGLTAVSESPDGGDLNAMYADDIKYASVRATENAKGTIEAYTYPEEFAACDGSAEITKGAYIKQQARKKFAFSYETNIGNDVSDSVGKKIHIIYNASVSPSERSYETINDSPDGMTMSWDYEADPVSFGDDFKPAAVIEIDSTKISAAKLKAIEDKLYGTTSDESTLPTPTELVTLLKANG